MHYAWHTGLPCTLLFITGSSINSVKVHFFSITEIDVLSVIIMHIIVVIILACISITDD